MENVYVNKIGIPQSLDGEHEWQVETLDFDTSCPCQITACDGGTINVCAKVNFKKGFIFDGDICDIDGGATFKSFTATDGYYVENAQSTCANPVARTRAVAYASDASNPPVVSTVYQCKSSSTTAEGAKIKINNTEPQTTNAGGTLQCGVLIEGGTVSNVKSIRVQTGDTADATIWNRSRGDQTFTTGVFHPGTFEAGLELTDTDLYGNTLPNPQRILGPVGGLPTNPFPNASYAGSYINLGYKNGEQLLKVWTSQINLVRSTVLSTDSNSKRTPTASDGHAGDIEGDIRWQTLTTSLGVPFVYLYVCFRDYVGAGTPCWTRIRMDVW